MTTPSSTARSLRPVLLVAAAGLAFQVLHVSEHVAQMAMWVAHPGRAPWMSPWAMDASRWLGRIDPGRAAETTRSVALGMEYLHLIGNAIFLVGALALVRLTAVGTTARGWARAGAVIQALHTLEHVALTATLLTVGRSIGLSTGFGTFDGTRLSTYRVWWHGSVNLLATIVCAVAVWSHRRAHLPRPPRARPARLLPAPAALGLGLPLLMAFTFGDPVTAPTGGHGAHAASGPGATVIDAEPPGEGHRLVDVAVAAGLDVTHSAFRWDVTMDPIAMMGGGVCWLDVDRDGWLDLFLTDAWSDGEWALWNSGDALPTTRIFRNVQGRFEEYTETWGAGFETRANGCVAADLDDDGFTDLYVTTSRANLLLWNEGGTGFVEGARQAGVDTYGWHTGGAAGDVDGDGRIDLFVSGYADLNRRRDDAASGFPNTFEPVADRLFLNRASENGRPAFVDASASAGLEPDGYEYGLGAVLADVDGDLDLDLYVANDTQPNRLYRNESTGDGVVVLRDVSAASGADDPNSGMGVATGDVNGDGVLDLAVTNLAGQGHAAFVSSRPASRSEPPARYRPGPAGVAAPGLRHTGWGASYADLDNDADLDLLIANGSIPITSLDGSAAPLVYLADQGTPGVPDLVDATPEVRLGDVADRNGRAVALADYDNDGDLDAAVTAIGGRLLLLRNSGVTGRHLVVDTRAGVDGAAVPGTRVRVTVPGGRILVRSVQAGGSWLSTEDPRLVFGLGEAPVAERVEVTWPDGATVAFDDIAADQRLVVTHP